MKTSLNAKKTWLKTIKQNWFRVIYVTEKWQNWLGSCETFLIKS